MIKDREVEYDPGLSGWAQYHHKKGVIERDRKMLCCWPWGRKKRPQAKGYTQGQKVGEVRNRFSPRA